MVKDASWKEYLSDNERYADLINGLGCKGRQVIGKTDLQETDTQTGIFAGLEFARRLPQKAGKRNIKIRDAVRKAAFEFCSDWNRKPGNGGLRASIAKPGLRCGRI